MRAPPPASSIRCSSAPTSDRGAALPAHGVANDTPHSGAALHLFAVGVARRIVKADVASLYPSLMRQYRIGPARDRLGVLLALVDDLVEQRLAAKAAARAAAPRSTERHTNEALSAAMKLIVNSAYGYLGAGGLTRFADVHAANEVTRRGREVLTLLCHELAARGVTLLEADTDGVYFAVPPAWSEADERRVVTEVAALLPDKVHLELEGRYHAMLSHEPKNYVLAPYAGPLVLRGVAFRSSRAEPFGERFLRHAIALPPRPATWSASSAPTSRPRPRSGGAQLPTVDVAARVRLDANRGAVRGHARAADAEHSYEAIAGQRSNRVELPAIAFASIGPSAAAPCVLARRRGDAEDDDETPIPSPTPRDYDVDYYVRLLRETRSPRAWPARSRPEDFAAVFADPGAAIAVRLLARPGAPAPDRPAHLFRRRPGSARRRHRRRRRLTTARRHLILRRPREMVPRLTKQTIEGALWGLLIGDALGVPYEFHGAADLPPKAALEMVPPAGFRRAHVSVPPGTWSDDGAQALCLLASLLAHDGLDLDDLGRRFLNWDEHGYMAVGGHVFDIGVQTGRALRALRDGATAAEAGPSDERANGNGSLMRVLPLALWHRGSDAALVELAHRQSRVTHGHPRSWVCCALYCLWARRMDEGAADPWAAAARDLRGIYRDHPSAAILTHELESSVRPDDEDVTVSGSGYVVDCLRSARWAVAQGSYEDVVKAAIALGNDTDTTACVAGGIAGLRDGLDAIPRRWREALREPELFTSFLPTLVSGWAELSNDLARRVLVSRGRAFARAHAAVCAIASPRSYLRLGGWTTVEGPPDLAKYVIVAAPHTAWVDGFWMIAFAWYWDVDMSWMVKHTQARFPFGWLLARTGAIPVDRSSPQGLVGDLTRAASTVATSCASPSPPRGRAFAARTGSRVFISWRAPPTCPSA